MSRMHPRVRLYLHRRQALLFLIAMLVPCVVLVALGLQTIDQDRQLASKRLADERRLFTEQTRQALLSELENIKLQEVARAVANNGRKDAVGRRGSVAFVGPVIDGRLQLSWENSTKPKMFQEWLSEGNFASQIREGERLEAALHQYENAADHYRAALNAADHEAERIYAHLLLARTFQKLGRNRESHAEYEHVMMSPPDLVDDLDVPLGLYAAPPLLQAGAKRNEILAWVRLASDEERALPPVVLRMVREERCAAKPPGFRDAVPVCLQRHARIENSAHCHSHVYGNAAAG